MIVPVATRSDRCDIAERDARLGFLNETVDEWMKEAVEQVVLMKDKSGAKMAIQRRTPLIFGRSDSSRAEDGGIPQVFIPVSAHQGEGLHHLWRAMMGVIRDKELFPRYLAELPLSTALLYALFTALGKGWDIQEALQQVRSCVGGEYFDDLRPEGEKPCFQLSLQVTPPSPYFVCCWMYDCLSPEPCRNREDGDR